MANPRVADQRTSHPISSECRARDLRLYPLMIYFLVQFFATGAIGGAKRGAVSGSAFATYLHLIQFRLARVGLLGERSRASQWKPR